MASIASTPSFAQKADPKKNPEYHSYYMRINLADSPDEQRLKAARETQQRIQKYFSNITKEVYPTVTGNKQTGTMERFEFKNCLDMFFNKISTNISQMQRNLDECEEKFNRYQKTEWDRLRQAGIERPENFTNELASEFQRLQDEVKKYTKKDEVVIVDNYISMEEFKADNLGTLAEIDENVISLTTDVHAIMVNLYESPNMQALVDKMEADETQESVGKDELIELTQMISLIKDHSNPCWTEGKIEPIVSNLKSFKGLKGKNKDKKIVHGDEFLIGVESGKDIEKIDGYKFTSDGVKYYLYQGKRTSLNEKIWVLAKINDKNEMSFRYYKIVKEQPNKIDLKEKDDINLLATKKQETTSPLAKGKFYYQGQQGLIIDAKETSIPVIGRTAIPAGRLSIAQFHMAYVADKSISESHVGVTSDAVTVDTQVHPTKNNYWTVGGGIRYSPISNSLRLSTNVRVHNLMIGYNDNLQRNESSANIGYVLKQNFLSVSTDFNKGHLMSLGRQFKNKSGGVMASTNFGRIHEVKLVLFMK